MNYQNKFYRNFEDSSRWVNFQVKVDTTDLFISGNCDDTKNFQGIKKMTQSAFKKVKQLRKDLDNHLKQNESFLFSFRPLKIFKTDSFLVKRMYQASNLAQVGPMAAVAGGIAELVGKTLLKESKEIMVENGGDLWLKVSEEVIINIFTNNIFFKDKINLKIYSKQTPAGICTSSGRLGPSFSYGRADAVTILAKDAFLADAVATSAANKIKIKKDIEPTLDYALSIAGVWGVVVVLGDQLALKGDLELVPNVF